MAECRQYLAILEESLTRKIALLTEFVKKNEEQAASIKAKDMDAFDLITEEKIKMIEELNSLDGGFNLVYEKIANELKETRANYTNEIAVLQTLIAEITDKSMAVQALEHRNKQLIEQHFSTIKKEIRKSKAGLKTASDYYKSMSRVDYTTPQMLDQKK